MITSLFELDALLVNNNIGSSITFDIYKPPASGTSWVYDYSLSPSQIVAESMEIKQSICDDKELKLGGAFPSQLKLDVMDVNDNLSGKRIAVTINTSYWSDVLYPSTALYPATDLYPYRSQKTTDNFVLFIGQIYSFKKTNNRKINRIVAYDRLYYSTTCLCKQRIVNFLQAHEADYFTIGNIISAFFTDAHIRQGSMFSSKFINYNSLLSMYDNRFSSLADDKFTYNDLVQQLCELNAAFLIEDMPGENLAHPNAHPRIILPYQTVSQPKYEISSYSQLQYDDFITKPIRYYQLTYNGGATYIYKTQLEDLPEYGHYISENVLTKCTVGSEVRTIIRTLDADFNGGTDCILGNVFVYRPFKASIFNRWWVQVGDRVKLPTVNDSEVPYVESIILSRKLKGIRNITVEIEAKGIETLGKENDVVSNE